MTRIRLGIRSVPVNVRTPQQTNYWLLPGQELPTDAGIDEASLIVDASLGKIAREWPGATPLDEDFLGRK